MLLTEPRLTLNYSYIFPAVLAYQKLSQILKSGGYHQILGSLGIWKYEYRKTCFCLCVDDFGVKYYLKEDVQHSHDTIAEEYTNKIDWTGQHFLAYKIKWNYEQGYVDIVCHIIFTMP